MPHNGKKNKIAGCFRKVITSARQEREDKIIIER
jgi:hypothetical protein